MTSTKSAFKSVIEEDLNREHNVTLKEGQISTILYVLEGYIQGSDDYHFDDNFKNDVVIVLLCRIKYPTDCRVVVFILFM